MKRITLAALVVAVQLGMSACAMTLEQRARQEKHERQERQEIAACKQRGWIWYTYADPECVSPEEARRRDDRRWEAEQREKDRQAALQQACITSGGTWYGWPTGCVGNQPAERR